MACSPDEWAVRILMEWGATVALVSGAGIGLRTVERSIRTLAHQGLISITRKPILKKGKSGSRNHYSLNLEIDAIKPPTLAGRLRNTKPHPLADTTIPA
jgi:hypothetical protein